MSGYHVDFGALDWESPVTGLRFKAVSSGGRRLRMVEYTPAMELHWCDKGHIGYVLDGKHMLRYCQQSQFAISYCIKLTAPF